MKGQPLSEFLFLGQSERSALSVNRKTNGEVALFWLATGSNHGLISQHD
jgi:hypothetical protein